MCACFNEALCSVLLSGLTVTSTLLWYHRSLAVTLEWAKCNQRPLPGNREPRSSAGTAAKNSALRSRRDNVQPRCRSWRDCGVTQLYLKGKTNIWYRRQLATIGHFFSSLCLGISIWGNEDSGPSWVRFKYRLALIQKHFIKSSAFRGPALQVISFVR